MSQSQQFWIGHSQTLQRFHYDFTLEPKLDEGWLRSDGIVKGASGKDMTAPSYLPKNHALVKTGDYTGHDLNKCTGGDGFPDVLAEGNSRKCGSSTWTCASGWVPVKASDCRSSCGIFPPSTQYTCVEGGSKKVWVENNYFLFQPPNTTYPPNWPYELYVPPLARYVSPSTPATGSGTVTFTYYDDCSGGDSTDIFTYSVSRYALCFLFFCSLFSVCTFRPLCSDQIIVRCSHSYRDHPFSLFSSTVASKIPAWNGSIRAELTRAELTRFT